MSRMLKKEEEGSPVTRFGAVSLVINNEAHSNTAAKFWSSLIDEVTEDYSDCDTLALSASCSQTLSREMLSPQDALQRDFMDLLDLDLEQVIRETVEELELYGMPSGVGVSLMAGNRELASMMLPDDCVDSGVFAYLVAWLMEWARIPEAEWNNESLSARLLAEDTGRKVLYSMDIRFLKRHLSEGLYRLSVSMRFVRTGHAD